jgi:glycosyltransferase 2 family protein
MRVDNLGRKLVLGLALGVAVFAGLGLVGDARQLAASLSAFQWAHLPAILALTLGNYGLRFVKWQYLLRVLGVPRIRTTHSMRIFFGGLAMTITPGKVGEWVKSMLLKEATGVPISTTAPIIIAERLSDGLAMALLASTALLVFEIRWEIIVASVVVLLAVAALSQHEPLARAVLRVAARLPLIRSRAQAVEAFYQSARTLLNLRTLGPATALGFVSWSLEGVAFYLVLTGLGLPTEARLVVLAVSILAIATIAGAASMLPGGLAAAEGSIAGLLLLTGVTADPAQAAAATLLIRFATLWFGVAVGFVALATLVRGTRGKEAWGGADTLTG